MPWPKGRPRSAETRAKISETLQGVSKTSEHKAALAVAAWGGREIKYRAAHMRAQCLPLICSYEDETCQGRLEAALLKDAPVSLIRTDDRGRRYFVGDDPRDGYMRLCVSHHRRYDSEGRAVLSDR